MEGLDECLVCAGSAGLVSGSCRLPAALRSPRSSRDSGCRPTRAVVRFGQSKEPSLPASSAVAQPLPDTLALLPFVQHVAAAGAVVTDLGESHGMRAVAARSSDQFMLFEVTPDGQAAVLGSTVELTPEQLETIASGNIADLGVEHGLPGFCAQWAAVPGVLRDA